MPANSADRDLPALAIEGLLVELEELEAEERSVSDRRRRAHERLERFPTEPAHREERELSTRRKELHEQIDALRVELGRTPGPTPVPSKHEPSFWGRTDDHA